MSRMYSAIRQQHRDHLSAIDNKELVMVRYAAERPSTFDCNIRSDGSTTRQSLAGSSESLSAC